MNSSLKFDRDPSRTIQRVGALLVLLLLMTIVAPNTSTQEEGENHPSTSTGPVPSEVASAEQILAALMQSQHTEALEKANSAIRRQQYYEIIGGIALLLMSILSIFGYRSIRDSLEKKAEVFLGAKAQELTDNLTKDFANKFDTMSSFIRDRAESQVTKSLEKAETLLLSYAQARLLFQSEKYAEALQELGIDDPVGSSQDGYIVNELPRPARRLAIESLCRSHMHQKKLGFVAWESAKKLYQETRDVEDFSLVLKLAVYLRRWDEGLEFYEIYEDNHKSQHQQEYEEFLFVILRKLGYVEKALELAEKYSDTKDVIFTNNIAALYRDVGKFNQAHDLLYPHVAKFMKIGTVAALPRGWHRVFNTFISNCIDRSRPGDAIDEAKFVLSLRHDALHVFSCLRLAMNLEDGTQKKDIINQVREIVPSLEPSDATIRITALLTEIDGSPIEAVKQIHEQIREAKQSQEKFITDKYHIYFLACLQGEILIRAGQAKQAIDVLHTPAQEELGGEAKFLLAHAYACDGNWDEATRWLSHAADETPKWAEKARDHRDLRKVPGVQKLIAKYSSSSKST